MNAFSRSWEITKLSFDVMMKDKELLLFPIIGGIFSILFFIAMLFPMVFLELLPTSPAAGTLLFYALIFALYFGLAFIATFFNTCAVYTIKTRFDGGNATFGESIRFSLSRIHLIFSWAIISAIVGLILRLLEDAAERMGEVGKIIMHIIVGILGALWGLISAFVIPGMVYHNIGPIDALKRSGQALKKTWGESLIRYYGLGLVQLVFVLVGIALFSVLSFILFPVSILLGFIMLGLGAIYIIGLIAFFSIANAVFNTALFYYAEHGKAPKGYRHDVLADAFKKEE